MGSRNSSSFWDSLTQLYHVIDPGRRREIWLLVLLTIAGAISEVVAIGSVVPFLALLADEGTTQHVHWIQQISGRIGVQSRSEQLALATALLCVAAIAAGLLRIFLSWRTQDFVYSFGHRLSVEVQRRMLLQPYSWHVAHNSSEQLATIEKAQMVTGYVLLPLVQALASTTLVVCVLALLLRIAPLATLSTALLLGATYFILAKFARRRLQRNSERIDHALERRIRVLQEGLGGIRDLILDGSQPAVLDQYRLADLQVAKATANSVFVSTVPRFLIESTGIVVIVGVAFILSARSGGLLAALPVLGALALGAQRLLPLIQQLYHGWSNVIANRRMIEDLAGRLRLALPRTVRSAPRLPFTRSIEFRKVSFTYADRLHPAVTNLNFEVRQGSRVALVGPTGSGKSTTADILMGLLEPTEGAILIDGVPLSESNRQAWRANVAHVPQMLFLADATVAQNIALTSDLDMQRVRTAAALAQLDAFIEALPKGYDTVVGERGAQISGGQRQRLAIARAIYKDTPLLVLDEATSALDDATEQAVLGALDVLQKQGRTIVIIAHRSTTTERCDEVLRLDAGRLVEFALKS